MREQTRQGVHVVLAVIKNCLLFSGGKRRPLQDAVAHIHLARSIELWLTEIAQRAGERIEALIAIGCFDSAVVGVVAKLYIGVERADRLSPTLRNMHAEFGSGHVSDKQRVGIE